MEAMDQYHIRICVSGNSEVPYLSQLISWIEIPVFGVLIFVVVGALFSVFLQSTVATIAFTMVLVYVSIVPFEAAIAMILGANVGTAINVEFASSAGNVHAKRSARIHSLFQLFGLIWALLLFPFILEGIQWLMLNLGWGDPIRYSADFGNTGLAIFHTIFNVTNALVLVWLIPNFVRLGERMVKSKGRSDEVFHLEFIGTGLLSTADLSILEAKKEIAKFGNLTIRMSTMTRSLLFEKNTREFEATLNRIKKYEDITDRIEIEVVKYLNKLSEGDLTLQTASRIRGMNSMVNDLERIGDIFYQMSKTIERKTNEKLWFTPEQRNNLSQQFDLVDEALEIMCENLVAHHDKVSLEKANDAERKINEKRNDLRKAYLEGLSNQDSNFKAGMVYNDLFSSLEKVGDHIINVSEAVVGKV
jgi:phosphate:Na+ symporter